jgi:UDP-N-acetylglucosamine--N-acetylmuramyl-(pentapeptide) pyrophosphoryl-undecaprenol N-acetylglucosamine transferase
VKVVIAGGGTAGHVNPAIALARALEGDDVVFVGTTSGAEASLVPTAGFDLHVIEVAGFDRAKPMSFPITAVRAGRAVMSARRFLREARPAVVVGMGGYVSLPVCVAAWTCGIPIVIHEQNIVFGLANRVVKRFARRIAVSYEDTLAIGGDKAVFVGNPVRNEILESDAESDRAAAIQELELDPARRTVLVFGGSQGARSINTAAAVLARRWGSRKDRQIVHITGRGHQEDTIATDGLIYRTPPFVDRMATAYAVADVAVCRGGATTLAELTMVGVPAIVVPYPFHRDKQQERQARVLERAGAVRIVADDELSPERLGNELDRILDTDGLAKKMSAAARSMATPDAARDLARVVREAA